MNRKSHRRRTLFLLSCFGVLACVFVAFRFFPAVDWITDLQLWMAGHGTLGAVVYVFVYALCNILLLPGGVLGIGSGLLFGLWWGFTLVLAGNVLSALVSFLIGRFFVRGWMERKIAQSPHWSALDAAIAKDGWKIIVLTQLHPLFPTSLLLYFYGATRISLARCVLWVTAGRAPGLFLYAYFGTLGQHGLNLLRDGIRPATYEFVVWGGGLVLTLLMTGMLGRLALRLLDQFRNPDDSSD